MHPEHVMTGCPPAFKSERAKSQSGYGFTKVLMMRTEPKSRLTPSSRIGQNAYFGFETPWDRLLIRFAFICQWLDHENDDI
jgi:hypothetical protein